MPENQGKSETARREEEILAFWKKHRVFEKSLKKEAPRGEFVFYDGPPFATGLPHVGNLLSFIIKDVVPRYKTMRGFRVPRRWGWDCHGLPIESLVEKHLGLKTKKDIEKIGVDTFNRAARESVLKYTDEWERYVDRVGRWVDFKNSYKTMDSTYVESVWWALKELHTKGLLYEGRKVLMYCPHCETPLAKAEIAMDHTYQDLTEEAVTVKFKAKNPEKHGLPANTYLLAWTTTPWTLPGNVALAVGPSIAYVLVEERDEHVLIAKERYLDMGKVVRKLGTAELVGVEYEPLFDIPALRSPTSYKVYAADFVSTEEGTGIVHTAVMYGEDDFALGQKEDLPQVQLLDSAARYNDKAPEFLRGKYIKDTEKDITHDLEKRGLLFSREMNTHSYPHCYRCGTPLIYNAVSSWFINIQKVKRRMLAENEKVTWVPEHLKHGRFKNIVESAPDWTISRNRYWASPLPIWKTKSGELRVIGSVAELLSLVKPSRNRYFLMRHGEAKSNIERYVDAGEDTTNHLTSRGGEEVRKAASGLRGTKVDLIISSPVLRARETALIAAQALGLSDAAVVFDERLRELGFGVFSGKPMEEYRRYLPLRERFRKAPEGGETFTDVRRRMGELLFDLEKKYVGKSILVISHGNPLWLMTAVASRRFIADSIERGEELPERSTVIERSFTPYPHNGDYELDLHRPYIDDIELIDEQGDALTRISEVVDCWVESGSMPFAAEHYLGVPLPHFNPRGGFFTGRKRFPGDFIAEYIAQTRTWFYYTHAMGVLLFNSRAFQTVVSTGTILAADGSKMSKSKGNYTDPLLLMDRFGADALRLYLMGSVVMQSEDLNFRDEEVREVHHRTIGILWNSYKFFELYRANLKGGVSARASAHVLDRWLFALLDETIRAMTMALDAYDIPRAVRALRLFIDDYSTWYLRRSRERVKAADADGGAALACQKEALEVLARLAAPLMPFIAESLYQGVGGKEQSVHLTEWPEARAPEARVLAEMASVRDIVSRAREARAKVGIKVRQPLARLAIGRAFPHAHVELIKDEVNVKEVIVDEKLGAEVVLDSTITPVLKEEGDVRDLVRAIQEARKKAGLTPADRPTLVVGDGADFVLAHRDELISAAALADVTKGEGKETVQLARLVVRFSLLLKPKT